VQGAGGMRFYSAQYLAALRSLCDEFKTLLILDEIATGFGRAGRMFACEYAGVQPDIMCLGKAITGGYVSFAATLASDEIADAISNSEVGAFMHGPTFMANPLACAAANASLDILSSYDVPAKIAEIENGLRIGLAGLKDCPKVADVRALGAIGVVEMREKIDVAAVQKELIARGVWLRPFGKLLYTMPPYIIGREQLKKLTSAISEVAAL